MTAKPTRGALVLVAAIASCLLVATPARAAQADVTIYGPTVVAPETLVVYGEVTCTEPTGTAHVSVFATQVMPFNFGSTQLDVPCAAGPVTWEAALHSSPGWQQWHSVSVNAVMTDDHEGTDGDSGTWPT